jgi:predicted ATP-grasp superfamily ATP-dependent carboligase
MAEPDLIIVGASARSAAFSAARSGYSPYWIDQYGDRDLAERFPGARVAAGRYPAGVVPLLRAAPQAPFLYTGAMENHAQVLRRLAALRPLFGNDADTCAAVRDPFRLRGCLARHGIAAPEIRGGSERAPDERWLCKPLRSGGGLGIGFADGRAAPPGHYLQQFVEGESCAGVFVADGRDAALVGVTLQLVGRREFHAPPFAYCGSMGPLPLAAAERAQWSAIGSVLAREFRLRGLFGVDAVHSGGTIVPIEVNPRYTASVEVHELAGSPPLLALHVAACGGTLPRVAIPPATALVAKAHLFAPAAVRIRPSMDFRAHAGQESIELADIPAADTFVPAGAPIMTILCRGDDEGGCARLLAGTARGLYHALA